MCGIAGFLTSQPFTGEQVRADIEEMTETLRHRGPDDSGIWIDPEAGVALGHRRLSILDLSPAGRQPMVSGSGRFVIIINGEIYNYRELRERLLKSGHSFRGTSDTEVMLECVERWGVKETVEKCAGMFALAVWDRKQRELWLGRDRIGEKPLYYGRFGHTFLFGSELKALRTHPAFVSRIDRGALALFMRHNYIPCPYSIYQGVYKLRPGTLLKIGLQGGEDTIVYWSARETVERGLAHPFTGDGEEAVSVLENLLSEVIAREMISDVPLGAFLSGGIDSSAIVALMQAQSSVPVKTFSIGFHEEGYNEAVHAREVARHLGTDHTELYVTPRETLDVIPLLPRLYDEPFADSSQIPTYLVASLARQKVTVSLSGDGGDELFGGYNRYFLGKAVWEKIRRLPVPLRTAAARAMTVVPTAGWDRLFHILNPVLPGIMKQRLPGDKIHKLAGVLGVRSPEELYRDLVSHWRRPSALVIGGEEPPTLLGGSREWEQIPDFTLIMMYLDLMTYLPDDILVKVDRACMGVSLESRVPFLYHRVVEFAWRLPLDMKVREGQGKWVLRQVLYKYVPPGLIDRPKMGFGVPIDSWLRADIREWAEELLDENRIRQEGFFEYAPIKEKWQEHLSGRRNWQYLLWDVLMFQAWYDNQRRQERK